MHHRHVTCPSCGREFYQDEPWKKTCLSCWKASKCADRTITIDADEVKEMRQQVESLQQQVFDLYGENFRLKKNQSALPSGMKDRIKDLIFLAHPDKHDGSPKATEITRWLLDVRREVGAAWQ